jgi:hypothetical protein
MLGDRRNLAYNQAMTRRHVLFTAAAATPAVSSVALPTTRWGSLTISRLIVGGNPVSGNSHVSPAADTEMRDYFTSSNIKQLLASCERAGINTWQSRGDRHILRILHEYRQEGGRIQWIAQTASEYADVRRNIREIAAERPIAIYHHGSTTDIAWRAGRIDTVRDSLKAMRDVGALAGIGTHIPEVVDYIEEKGWDVDFYMTCVYNLSRTRQEASQLAGTTVEGELFWDADRERMLTRVKATSKPCLIFKVYGATRQCQSAEDRRNAMALAFRYAKPSDAVVVGMFPKHQEQVRENCRLVADAIPLSSTRR